MDTQTAKAASALLVQTWQDGAVLDALPPSMRPSSRLEGYLIQAQVEALSLKPLLGWKIAATSLAGQTHIGVDGPLAGRLLAETAYEDGSTVPLGSNRMRVAEPEFAFKMQRDLPPREEPYAVSDVMGAVADLYLAIEIPDSRYSDFVTAGGPQIIADNACAHRLVVGPKAPEIWRSLDLAVHKVQAKVGTRYVRDGVGLNVLGDPRIALTWLANELRSIGVTLAAGQIVITGTCMVPLELNPGDDVSIDFGNLGRVGFHLGEH